MNFGFLIFVIDDVQIRKDIYRRIVKEKESGESG